MLNNAEWLRARLTEKRFKHSLAVRERAVFLAGLYGEDTEKAALAGLLHDCCHCLSYGEQLKIISSRGILLDNFTAALPQLWHAIAGSIIIKDELGVEDADIISAVRWHTTGAAGMSVFGQIIYLADLTSSDRDYPGVRENRELSEKSLGLCMLKSLSFTLERLTARHEPIVRDAWEAYNYFWEHEKENGI